MTDLTRGRSFNEKKTRSVAAGVITYDQVVGTTVHDLFVLPERAIVTAAYLVPEVASQAAITVDIGFKGGAGNELFNDAAVSNTTVKTTNVASVDGNAQTNVPTAIALLTGTGKTVTAQFSAQPTAGRFAVVVEFIEYTLGNGDLLNYSPE